MNSTMADLPKRSSRVPIERRGASAQDEAIRAFRPKVLVRRRHRRCSFLKTPKMVLRPTPPVVRVPCQSATSSAAFLVLIASVHAITTAYAEATGNAYDLFAGKQSADRDAHVRRDLKVNNNGHPSLGTTTDALPSHSVLARFSIGASRDGLGSTKREQGASVTAGRELRNYGLLRQQGRRKRQPPGQVTLKPYQDKLPIPKTIDVTKAKGGSDPDLTMGVHSVKWVRGGQISMPTWGWDGSLRHK